MGFSSAYFIIIFFDIFDICAVACGSGNDTYQKKRKNCWPAPVLVRYRALLTAQWNKKS